MEELLDMIVSDESPSNVSDKVKEILYSKAAEKIELLRPEISNSMFSGITEEE